MRYSALWWRTRYAPRIPVPVGYLPTQPPGGRLPTLATPIANVSTDWRGGSPFPSPLTRYPKTSHSGARRNPDEQF